MAGKVIAFCCAGLLAGSVLTVEAEVLPEYWPENAGQTEAWVTINSIDPDKSAASSSDASRDGAVDIYQLDACFTTDGGKTFSYLRVTAEAFFTGDDANCDARVVFHLPVQQCYDISLRSIGEPVGETEIAQQAHARVGASRAVQPIDFDSSDSAIYYTGADVWSRPSSVKLLGSYSLSSSYRELKDC